MLVTRIKEDATHFRPCIYLGAEVYQFQKSFSKETIVEFLDFVRSLGDIRVVKAQTETDHYKWIKTL